MKRALEGDDQQNTLETIIDGNLKDNYPIEEVHKVCMIHSNLILISSATAAGVFLSFAASALDGSDFVVVLERRPNGSTGNEGGDDEAVSYPHGLHRMGGISRWQRRSVQRRLQWQMREQPQLGEENVILIFNYLTKLHF